MRIPVRFGLFFLLFLVMTGGSYFYQWQHQIDQQQALKQLHAEEFMKTFRTIVGLKSASTKTYAYDYSYWGEMVAFTKSKDPEWAYYNIESTIESMQTDYAAVVTTDGRIIYETGTIDAALHGAIANYPFNFAAPTFPSFFVATPSGPFEVYAGPIQNSDDTERTGKPQGYFVTAKLWDKTFINELASITAQKIALVTDNGEAYDIIYPIKGADGTLLYRLGITLETPTFDTLKQFFAENLIITFLTFGFWAVLFMWMFYRYIITPLGIVTLAMRHGAHEPLRTLVKRNDEMGQIARLVRDFSEQHTKLQEEIERVAVQDQLLIQQNRRAAMGEMIGNIAHQWRQPINIVALAMQKIDVLQRLNKLDDAAMEEAVQIVSEQIAFMSQTIDDFRNFFQPDKQPEHFTLTDAYRSTMGLIGTSLRNHAIRLEEQLDHSVCADGFPNEFAQVLLNIIGNAKDALVEKQTEDRLIRVSISQSGDDAIVTVEDNGGGIPDKIIGRIFDPYFTTKEQGKGTGIGLYMAKMIIEESMHGTLEAENSGDGARFTIRIASASPENS